jgi:hypothetical protein
MTLWQRPKGIASLMQRYKKTPEIRRLYIPESQAMKICIIRI